METKNNYLAIIFFLLLFSDSLFSQAPIVNYPPSQPNFFSINQQMIDYIQQNNINPDEGDEVNEYSRWRSFWELRLDQYKGFRGYQDAMIQYSLA